MSALPPKADIAERDPRGEYSLFLDWLHTRQRKLTWITFRLAAIHQTQSDVGLLGVLF